MTTSKFLIAASLLSVILIACGGENKDTRPASKETTQADEAVPAAGPTRSPDGRQFIVYVVTANNLLLRDQPTQKSTKVITKFKEGELVTGQGETSGQREKTTLRGVEYEEPYLKVESTKPERHTGWAYSGALQPLYAGEQASSPDLTKISQLSAYLTGLNFKKLDSGAKAWAYARANFSNAGESTTDAAFILLERLLRRMEEEGYFYNTMENIRWTQQDYEDINARKFDASKYPQTKALDNSGFRLIWSNGMVYPAIDWLKLQGFFGTKVSPAMRTFISQQVEEQNHPADGDGGLMLSLEQVADRAGFWEKFNTQNPHFPLRSQSFYHQRWYGLILITGTDNLGVFNYETQTLRAEYQQAWAHVTQNYPETELARVIDELRQLVKAEGGKRSKKVQDFQDEQSRTFMRGLNLPR